MVWYSHLFQNFPQFIVIHTVKGFGIVNTAEIDVFLELSCFFDDPTDVGNVISGSSGSVSCGVTAPFSWVLVCTSFCLCPPRVCFPVLCKFWQLYGGLMMTSSKRAYAIPRSAAPRALPLQQATADPYLHRRHSNTVLAQSLWGLRALLCTGFV